MKSDNSIFRDFNFSTPVLLCEYLDSFYTALGVARSLGRLGVPVYGLAHSKDDPALCSKYSAGTFVHDLNPATPDEEIVQILVAIAEKIGRVSVLIPVFDRFATFVARNSNALKDYFYMSRQDAGLIAGLANKRLAYFLALEHGVPAPRTVFPQSRNDVVEFGENTMFPVILKTIDWNLPDRQASRRMIVVKSADELIREYHSWEEADSQNLMLQEYICGEKTQDWLFNGYFDEQSNCLAAFSGKKVRQFPVGTGYASLGECSTNRDVESLSIRFLQAVGYTGMVDMDYRYDDRDGLYKLLDVNPRLGATFRLFVGRHGLDVVRAMYLDISGQKVPQDVPIEGRKWILEDRDVRSALSSHRRNDLTLGAWAKSLRNVQEGAWFALDDPGPFFMKLVYYVVRRLKLSVRKAR